MNIELGFRGQIYVTNLADEKIYEEDSIDSLEKIQKFINEKCQSVPGASLFGATLFPTRTDNFKDYAKDLFLPTFCNHVLKIRNVALRILAAILAIPLDIVTFIPRLLTTPYQIYQNQRRAEHPLIPLVRDNPAAAESIRSGSLIVNIKFESVKEGSETTRTQKLVKGFILVNTKELPGSKPMTSFEITTNSLVYVDIVNENNEIIKAWDSNMTIRQIQTHARFEA